MIIGSNQLEVLFLRYQIELRSWW